jgi:hypothetical protein
MNSFIEDRFHPPDETAAPAVTTRAIAHARTLSDTAAGIARKPRDALRSDREHALALRARR